MSKDPYHGIIKIMRNEGAYNNPASLELARVVTVKPLVIKVGELQINEKNLFINETLLEYVRKINLKCNTKGNVVASDHTGNLENIEIKEQEITFLEYLKAGDLLSVQAINNNQAYVILCKVVKL
ncbi:MAG: DUF2577 family protein [Sarcina sp.]